MGNDLKFIKTWRWFGEQDPVRLPWIKEMGVEEIVTALHHIPGGEIWTVEEIGKIKKRISQAGLGWSVVESLPVSEAIKTGGENRGKDLRNYKQSLQNLAKCGIKTVVYNFMPVLDWIRTDLNFRLPSGGISLFFDYPKFAAFDIFILKRPGAETYYDPRILEEAERIFSKMAPGDANNLAYTIIVKTQNFINAGVKPGKSGYREAFLDRLKTYGDTGKDQLRKNFSVFLNEVVPVAQKAGINMAIHPDDPPFPVLGLPRIFSTVEDMEWLNGEYPSPNNGIAFCTGSLSARNDNNLIEMANKYGHLFHFVHLRNIRLLDDGSFYETGHLEGDVNMPALMDTLLEEMQHRKSSGRKDFRIPVRPDHGINIMDDLNLVGNPGYPLIGRLKGMAELTGIEETLLKFRH